ncbi:ABC transporter ATP-binding protein [Stakelama tenebrarum]|uniref:ABC transporter ATP-binding protein n=1 Tax=Stakelama tenebrarum TaxID=2711215 RepID=A0A6G6Y9R6_9SPHN|nr:ABC transporter ATP-binding protein [Sphingosinithalassobacter tenebrarum]QIG81316.1 ABC transporter ATP-binding protein [Sphingosinithalassobacter tenebrarum]
MDLSAKKLDVTLGGRRVLHGIDAVFRPGQVTAVLGANGSGKTTLLRTLAGLQKSEHGSALFGDRVVTDLDPRERARTIGYLPQDGAVHWNITAGDLVMLGRTPHRSPFAGPSPADWEAVVTAMSATATLEFADRTATELSGGERARVLLARVLAGQPQWLLADEPLASLDPAHQLDLLAQFRRLADEGIGVVMVLHDLIHAARAADAVLLLHEGRAVAFGPAAEILAPDPLRAAFGVEVMAVEDRQGIALPILTGRSPR